ncbi:branched-chain amino acid ABC transporter permease [Castellaniella sp. MT123]|uniref:branched-chain amino acid ABC transporter permease n=1 Tax=Castellaniella sp. MT123 TaxID=3140381 RepID=UPI0031F45A24|nr:branched-chain amino acid ABC transporter permease [Castellaniella sp.]
MPYWIGYVGGYTDLASRLLIIGLAAMATNLLVGHSGVMAFGHAAYFGLSSYTTGLMIKYLIPSTPVGFLAGIIVGTLGGAIIGFLLARLRGIYFALATIAFGQVFFFIAFRWNAVTGGDNGLSFQRQPIDLGFLQLNLGSSRVYYYVALAVFAVCAALMAVVLRSPFGRTLLAMRENERRARFLSIPVNRHLWMAYIVSCFFVAVAGSLYGMLNNFVSPHDLHWTQSGDFVLMAVIGGMRSFWGPLLGAAIFVVAQDYLSSLTGNWMFFIGMLFVLVVLFLPRGIAGLLQRRTS